MTGNRIRTDALIAQLSVAPAPPRFSPRAVAVGLALAALAGTLAYLWSMGPRVGLAESLLHPVSLLKIALPLALSALALTAAVRLAEPARPAALWPLALPAGIAVALFLWTLAGTPAPAVGAAIIGETLVKCLVSVVAMALLPLAVALAVLRRGAATRPALTGAVIGLASGAAATAGYALSCAEDSPLFFVTWYGAAIAIMAGLGAVVGARLLRW
jgi:hypothetical protein